MKEKITFKKNFMFLLTLAMFLWQVPKVNAQVTFNGTLQSNPISICDENKPLQVDFTVGQATTNAIKVSVQLANGIEYDGGLSIVSSAPAGAFTIAEDDVSVPGNPTFTISKNSAIALADNVVFTFNRKAVCTAYENALTANDTGFEFIDEVTIDIDGSTKSQASLPYSVVYPNLVLTPPLATNDANIGDVITRTYKVENGGLTSAKKVIVTLDYENPAYFQAPGAATLEVDAGSGFVALTGGTVSGTKVTYVIEGANLGTGNELVNGASIILREVFELKTCNPTTHYTAGWGCDNTKPCQEVDGSSIVTMAGGAPNFNSITYERVDYTNMCSDYKLKIHYTNSGNGAMYDVGMEFIGGSSPESEGFTKHTFSNVNINGNAIANSFTATNPIYAGVLVKTGDVFNTDPDGTGTGLEDLDGDGFYDDLAGGQTVDLEVTVTIKPEQMTCGEALHDVYNRTNMYFRTACAPQEQKVVHRVKNPLIDYRRTILSDASYMPATIEAGTPFSDNRIGFTYYSYGNKYRSADTRFVTVIEVPNGMTLSNIKWVDGRFPSGATPVDPQSVTQNGNTITVVSPSSVYGHITFDAVYECQADNSNVVIDYKVHEVADYANYPDCLSLGENIICESHPFTVINCGDCPAGVSTGLAIVEREDNSLGWTDATMTTLQSRNNISKYDLAKALYKDEFKVETTATQYGAATNLGARLVVANNKLMLMGKLLIGI